MGNNNNKSIPVAVPLLPTESRGASLAIAPGTELTVVQVTAIAGEEISPL